MIIKYNNNSKKKYSIKIYIFALSLESEENAGGDFPRIIYKFVEKSVALLSQSIGQMTNA